MYMQLTGDREKGRFATTNEVKSVTTHEVINTIITQENRPPPCIQDEISKTYSFPKSFVSYRKPRAVSTEQRERARQMMIERNKEKNIKDFL